MWQAAIPSRNMQGVEPPNHEILRMLSANDIQFLYHFTDVRNLSLILDTGGLLPRAELERSGRIGTVTTGGDPQSQVEDRKWRNEEYVHLNFWPKTPMAYYRELDRNLCYLVIDSKVAARAGVVFTETNAITGGHQRGEGVKGLGLVDFRVRTHRTPWEDPDSKRKYQAEVLVPGMVEITVFKRICFRSEALVNEGLRCCGNRRGIPFDVDESLFNRPVGYLLRFGLTQLAINGTNVSSYDFQTCTNPSSRRSGSVTAVAYASMPAGESFSFEWRNARGDLIGKHQGAVDRAAQWYAWDALDVRSLPPGRYYVILYLHGVYQATLEFNLER